MNVAGLACAAAVLLLLVLQVLMLLMLQGSELLPMHQMLLDAIQRMVAALTAGVHPVHPPTGMHRQQVQQQHTAQER